MYFKEHVFLGLLSGLFIGIICFFFSECTKLPSKEELEISAKHEKEVVNKKSADWAKNNKLEYVNIYCSTRTNNCIINTENKLITLYCPMYNEECELVSY